jgi:hypothetical protein
LDTQNGSGLPNEFSIHNNVRPFPKLMTFVKLKNNLRLLQDCCDNSKEIRRQQHQKTEIWHQKYNSTPKKQVLQLTLASNIKWLHFLKSSRGKI